VSRFHQIVLKHYPLARIDGDGHLALISTCGAVPRVWLFDLSSARQATAELWAAYGCADGVQCSSAHFQKRIRLEESPLSQPTTVADSCAATRFPSTHRPEKVVREYLPRYCWEADRD